MVTVPVDDAKSYFEYPVLDKIHRETAWESIRCPKKKLKANAQTVIYEFGKGQHSHADLILSPIKYALLSKQNLSSSSAPLPPGHPSSNNTELIYAHDKITWGRYQNV